MLWRERCNRQHNTDQQKENTYLYKHYQSRVTKLYSLKDRVDACDRQLFDRPIEDIYKLPLYQIKKWLLRNESFVKDAINRYNKRIRIGTKGIQNFFKTIATNNSTNHLTHVKTTLHKKKVHTKNITQKIKHKNYLSKKAPHQQKNKASTLASKQNTEKSQHGIRKQIQTVISFLPRVKLKTNVLIPANTSTANFDPP